MRLKFGNNQCHHPSNVNVMFFSLQQSQPFEKDDQFNLPLPAMVITELNEIIIEQIATSELSHKFIPLKYQIASRLDKFDERVAANLRMSRLPLREFFNAAVFELVRIFLILVSQNVYIVYCECMCLLLLRYCHFVKIIHIIVYIRYLPSAMQEI